MGSFKKGPNRPGPERRPLALLAAPTAPIPPTIFRGPMQAPFFAATAALITWIPSPTLMGQDQFYGAPGQVPKYDNPLPARATPIPQGWTGQTPAVMLAAATPFVNANYSTPAQQTLLQQGWISTPPPVAPTVTIPFVNQNWSLPAQPTRQLQGWTTQLILLGKDQFYGAPGQVPGYDNPLPRAPTPILQSWTQKAPPIVAPISIQPLISPNVPLPVQPTRLLQSWTQGASLSALSLVVQLRQPMQAPQFAPTPILQSWTQGIPAGMLPVPLISPPSNLPAQPPRLLQSWRSPSVTPTPPIGTVLRNPMQCSMQAHWYRDRSYLAFENMSYSPDGVSPTPNAVMRGPLVHRRIEPAYILQSWTQSASLSALSLKVQLRQPMQAPQFASWWQQAWNPVNLLGLYSASNNFRFRVTGSVIVRRLK